VRLQALKCFTELVLLRGEEMDVVEGTSQSAHGFLRRQLESHCHVFRGVDQDAARSGLDADFLSKRGGHDGLVFVRPNVRVEAGPTARRWASPRTRG
jgi:hypothetical protein